MEQYLTVGNCKPGEEKTFSLIEVYPYMHYDSNHTEDDLNRAFQFSLDPKRCSYNIHVRSKEAQEEVTNFLIGYGFENVRTNEAVDATRGLMIYYRDNVIKAFFIIEY